MASIINLNDTTPAAPAGKANVKWQADAVPVDPTVARNVSAYVVSPELARLIDVLLSSPADGDALVYSSGSGKWINTPTSGGGGSIVPAFADEIIPAGTVDGSNDTFTLPNAPSPAASLRLFNSEGRLLAASGVDFTLSGATITYVTASIPQPGDRDPKHIAYYRH